MLHRYRLGNQVVQRRVVSPHAVTFLLRLATVRHDLNHAWPAAGNFDADKITVGEENQPCQLVEVKCGQVAVVVDFDTLATFLDLWQVMVAASPFGKHIGAEFLIRR